MLRTMKKIIILKYIFLALVTLFIIYLLIPKYQFTSTNGLPIFRCNKITGSIKCIQSKAIDLLEQQL